MTPLASAGGTIDPSTAQSVAHNDQISFTLTPDTGYGIDNVASSCGGTLGGNTFTTDVVIADCTVEASFALNSYTITASVGGGQGSITPASQPVDHGDSANFTVTPETGWSVASVSDDTCSSTDAGGGTWTASNITADCTLQAAFEVIIDEVFEDRFETQQP